jgi:hypothetical protein
MRFTTLIRREHASTFCVCSELTPAQADDFNATLPNFLPLVQSAPVRQWALDVHQLWNDLYRVVRMAQDNSSIAPNCSAKW